MIKLNPFAISGLLIFIPYSIISIFVLIRGKTKLTKLFAFLLIAVSVWGLGAYLIGTSTSAEKTILIIRWVYPAVIFIPIFFLHSVYLFLGVKKDLFLYICYLQGCFFSYVAIIGKMFDSAPLMFDSLYYQQGRTYLLIASFISWIIICLIIHIKLFLHYKKTDHKQRKQIMALMWSAPLGFGGGAMNFFPALGINIYPYGNFLVPIYFLIITYAILKYQLLDILVVVKKSVIYSTSIALLSILYLLTVFALEKFAQGVFGYRSLAISILTAFGLGLIFVPLRHRIQQLVDRYFFKGTQQEIASQNEQLRQEIADSDKHKTLSTLASGIAHEIKNPLTSIKTFCEYLPQKLDDKEFLKKFARLIGHEVDRMDNMVHELLDYSKPAPLALKKTDINKLIEDTINTLNSQFIRNRIEVTQHLSTITYHLNIDANRIKQALLNLFLNAIEAMPTGGQLTVRTTLHSSRFTISITDTGSGIPPEDLKHIFDPFFSRKDQGTGLGLAIVQGIVEQHKGKIRITSKVGVGTTVRLEFPIYRENTLNDTKNTD